MKHIMRRASCIYAAVVCFMAFCMTSCNSDGDYLEGNLASENDSKTPRLRNSSESGSGESNPGGVEITFNSFIEVLEFYINYRKGIASPQYDIAHYMIAGAALFGSGGIDYPPLGVGYNGKHYDIPQAQDTRVPALNGEFIRMCAGGDTGMSAAEVGTFYYQEIRRTTQSPYFLSMKISVNKKIKGYEVPGSAARFEVKRDITVTIKKRIPVSTITHSYYYDMSGIP